MMHQSPSEVFKGSFLNFAPYLPVLIAEHRHWATRKINDINKNNDINKIPISE